MSGVSGWPYVRLHDISSPRQWQTVKKADFRETGYPVYGANGIIGRYHSFNHKEPTILIGCRGTCGAVNVTQPEAWVTGNAMALDNLDDSRVELRFLVHALRADGLKGAITGTSQPQITQNSLRRVQIPLPPKSEQRRIATLLDAAEALREKRRHALNRLDTLTRSIFIDMFGDPLMNSSFSRVPIGSAAEIVTGNTPSRSVSENYGDHIEWLKSGNISESGEVTCAAEYLSQLGRAKGREAPAGSTLVVCIAGSPRSIGRAGYLDRSAAFNQQINAVIPGPSILPEFLFQQLRAGQRLVQRASTNSMKGMVSKSALATVGILVPPLESQRRFVELAESIGRVRRAYSESLDGMNTLCASLQQRAFRGEL